MKNDHLVLKAILLAMVLAISILLVEATWTDTREEESYRNDVAIHMMHTGNYSVPYRFGDRYLKKPPGTNWSILLASFPFGTVTDFSGRIPILLLYLLLPLTIFVLIRHQFSVIAASTAAVASVLYLPWFVEKGPIMELDLLFTFFVVVSQTVWFYYHRDGHDTAKWIGGHLFLAAAFLIKGPPAFLFFYGTILIFQWSFADRKTNWWAFLGGLMVFLVPTGAWFASTLEHVTLTEWWELVINEMSGPAQQKTAFGSMLYHYISYPVETIGSFFPWVLFLLPLTSQSFREHWWTLWDERPVLSFSVAALPVWFAFYPLPASDVRYILPIYPWLAILSASVLDLPETTLTEYQSWAQWIQWFYGIVFVLLAIALPLLLPEHPSHSIYVVIGSMIGFLIVAGVIFCYTFDPHPYRNLIGCALITVLTIKAGFLFVHAPVENPKWFVRKQYATQVADYLEKNEIKPCLSTGQRVHYYLHQRFTGITDCDPTPIAPSSDWVLNKGKPSDREITIRKTFTHPLLQTLYLYKKTD